MLTTQLEHVLAVDTFWTFASPQRSAKTHFLSPAKKSFYGLDFLQIKKKILFLSHEEKMSVEQYRLPTRGNVEKVLKNFEAKEGVIYLTGQVVLERDDTDVELPFRQESNFFYVTGKKYRDIEKKNFSSN